MSDPIVPSRPARRRAFAAVSVACVVLSSCNKFTPPAMPAVAPRMGPVPGAPDPPPAPESATEKRARRPVEPAEVEPSAVAARANAIRRDAEAIRALCQQAAGGDWERWKRETEPHRAALRAKCEALQEFKPERSKWPEGKFEPLEGLNGFPLFEPGAREHLRYLYDSTSLDEFRKGRSVVAIHRWLRKRGVDLIFVIVPKMTEVYADHFVDRCPADGIIGPHVRQAALDLLQEDVEVVDAFSLLRSLRDTDTEYLANTTDTHWAPRAMRIVARELADRIARYRFGARARYGMPIVISEPRPYMIDGERGGHGTGPGWVALNAQQQARAARAQTMTLPFVTMPDHSRPPDDPDSPVMLMGNSYLIYFREQFIKEINLLVRTSGSKGLSLGPIADLLRDPELFEGARVLVWIAIPEHLMSYRTLPRGLADALTQ